MYDKTPPGVCMGLAWTSHGGSTLYIETIKQKRRKSKLDKDGQEVDTGNGTIEYTGLNGNRFHPKRTLDLT